MTNACIHPSINRFGLVTGLLFVSLLAGAQSVRTISLEEAKSLVLSQNRLLNVSRLREQDSADTVRQVRSAYYPNVNALGTFNYSFTTRITFEEGQFGTFQDRPIPDKDYTFNRKSTVFLGGLQVQQPLSQLGKVTTLVKLAETGVAQAKLRTTKSEMLLKQGVEKLYYGLLIAQQQKELANVTLQLSQLQLYDVESALLAGETDSTKRYGLQAQIAAQQQKILQTDYDIANNTADLVELLGLPLGTDLQLQPVTLSSGELSELTTYLQTASTDNVDIKQADLTLTKASYGVRAAKQDFLPNLTLTGGYSYQTILSFLPPGNLTAGLLLSWKLVDWGARRSVLDLRQRQQQEASDYLAYLRNRVATSTAKAYRVVSQSAQLVKAAEQSVVFRQQQLRYVQGQKAAGAVLPQAVLTAQVSLAQAETERLSAQLTYRTALVDLNVITGSY